MLIDPTNPSGTIGTIHIVLTTYCNLGCKGCYQSKEAREDYSNQNNFNLEENEGYISNLFSKFKRERKQIKIAFFGGEPLLKYNTILEILDYLKDTNQIPDIITIPTSGGPNQNLIDTGLKTVEKIDQLFPETKITFSLSYDGPRTLETRNQNISQMEDSFFKIYTLSKKLNKDIQPEYTVNLIPQIIDENYFIETYDNIVTVTGITPSFRLPHLLDADSNLDNITFLNAVKNWFRYSIDENLPIKLQPKLFKDIIDRIIKNNDTIEYTWCQAGLNHFSIISNPKQNSTLTDCEYLSRPAQKSFSKMMENCSKCPIVNYCSKPCLKTMESNVNIYTETQKQNQFNRACRTRIMLYNGISDYLKQNNDKILNYLNYLNYQKRKNK